MAEEKKNGKTKQESAEVKEEIKETKAEEESLAEIKERLLRLAAEFDNYKKRIAKEMDASKSMGKAEIVKKILPALDEFELAITAMEDGKEGSKTGVELVYSNLIEALKHEGLEVIEAKGKFDPYKHEIMLTKESEKGEGTIVEVVRKGYMFNDIMLRPASVIVAKQKPADQKDKK